MRQGRRGGPSHPPPPLATLSRQEDEAQKEGRQELRLRNPTLTVALCVPCHRNVHVSIGNAELQRGYDSVEALRDHPGVRRFTEWVKDKPHGLSDAVCLTDLLLLLLAGRGLVLVDQSLYQCRIQVGPDLHDGSVREAHDPTIPIVEGFSVERCG